MAQIHPHQYLYFNFFVDRKTPERLRARYVMDYWEMTLRQGYEHMLRHAPAAAINMRLQAQFYAPILPAAARNRFTHDPSRDPDFRLSKSRRKNLNNDDFVPILHRFKVYNNTILTVATPDLSRVDPAVADEYRALHRAATAGEPAARAGGYEVYLHGGRLAWVKEACEPGALRRKFRIKLYPEEARFLRHPHQERGYIEFEAYGVRFDDKCLGSKRLPDFALARVHLSQWRGEGRGYWEADIYF